MENIPDFSEDHVAYPVEEVKKQIAIYSNRVVEISNTTEPENPLNESQQLMMNALIDKLFGEDDGGGDDGGDAPGTGDNNGGSGGNESGGGDIPSTTTTYSTFTLDDGTVEEYKINGVLDNDWFCANGFKTITNGTTTWVKNIVKASIGTGVTAFGSYVFMSSTLSEITIPNGVTDIWNSAFKGCDSLKSMTIPDSVTSIGDSAFESCSGLTSVTIPNSVTSIGAGVFAYCIRLTSVTISNSVTSIGNSSFAYCSELTSVIIPNGVKSIGNSAFAYCS